MTVLFLAHTRTPELSRRLLCHVGPGPGNKSVGQAEPGQIFTGLSRMVVSRQSGTGTKNHGTVLSLVQCLPRLKISVPVPVSNIRTLPHQ